MANVNTRTSICRCNAHQFSILCRTKSSPSLPLLLPRFFLAGVTPAALVEEQATMEVLEEEEEVVRAVEAGNFFLGEEFSVDDLLNLEFVGNVEEEEEADGDGGEVDDVVDKKEMEVPDSSSVSSNSSTVSFEPPLVLPAHDAEEFEWVSLIMDESPSEFPSCSGVVSSPSATQSLGDVGTLTENSTGKSPLFVSSSVCILLTEPMVPVKAKRSKRSRSTTAAASAAWFTPGPLFLPQSTSGSSSSSFLTHDHQHAGAAPSFPPRDSPPQTEKQKPKKCGRKPKSSPCLTTVVPGERCCAHCGAQKTPQWRAGPLGNKTLCNACGVRFKSGRLLPEYRPAGSPTFVSCIHSNCHRKVLEMRRNKEAPPPVPSF